MVQPKMLIYPMPMHKVSQFLFSCFMSVLSLSYPFLQIFETIAFHILHKTTNRPGWGVHNGYSISSKIDLHFDLCKYTG